MESARRVFGCDSANSKCLPTCLNANNSYLEKSKCLPTYNLANSYDSANIMILLTVSDH